MTRVGHHIKHSFSEIGTDTRAQPKCLEQKQPQSPKEQPKKADQKGDDNKKQGGQPKGEKQ
ncbi:hypothetical protein E3U43_013239 [Larimichthys crocea]|uniref:Uncharacterized protein n=1 Tax=Larimichthys crocea TaxID=215358 RepID=A0ACD3RAF4_LARCR|nr:hypothetical protein E3U43_013239 [Larimichthys crocea]